MKSMNLRRNVRATNGDRAHRPAFRIVVIEPAAPLLALATRARSQPALAALLPPFAFDGSLALEPLRPFRGVVVHGSSFGSGTWVTDATSLATKTLGHENIRRDHSWVIDKVPYALSQGKSSMI